MSSGPVRVRVWPLMWVGALLLASLAGLVAAAEPAPAKPPAKAAGKAPATAQRPTIKEEVRECLDTREALRRERLALIQRFDRHEAELRLTQAEQQTQAALQAGLDTTNAAAVEAHNARIAELNARIVTLNAQAGTLGDDQRSLNTRVADLNRRCAGLVISWNDHEAVLRERTKAASSP
jgi:chromosome segregation ATPase